MTIGCVLESNPRGGDRATEQPGQLCAIAGIGRRASLRQHAVGIDQSRAVNAVQCRGTGGTDASPIEVVELIAATADQRGKEGGLADPGLADENNVAAGVGRQEEFDGGEPALPPDEPIRATGIGEVRSEEIGEIDAAIGIGRGHACPPESTVRAVPANGPIPVFGGVGSAALSVFVGRCVIAVVEVDLERVRRTQLGR
jgi:hypothetical protein